MERKPLPKKVRFEVLKRDRFTCQYCGRKAPDVVLHVDHIHPVADGGIDDMTNLVTACSECNLGKGARLLDRSDEMAAARERLEELADRREQLDMMYEWQKELLESETRDVDLVESIIEDLSGSGLNDVGRKRVRGWLGEFGLPLVAKAAKIAFTQYDVSTDGKWEWAFSKIGGICHNIRRDE